MVDSRISENLETKFSPRYSLALLFLATAILAVAFSVIHFFNYLTSDAFRYKKLAEFTCGTGRAILIFKERNPYFEQDLAYRVRYEDGEISRLCYSEHVFSAETKISHNQLRFLKGEKSDVFAVLFSNDDIFICGYDFEEDKALNTQYWKYSGHLHKWKVVSSEE